MSTRVPALALSGLFTLSGLLPGCGPAAAPAPADQPARPTAPTTAEPATKAATPGKADTPITEGPRPTQEPPLTQEEIDLIAADPVTLSPEMRRKRAFALRRKILQNPDSPTARQLEALRLAAEKGELQSQLPPTATLNDKGLTLHAPGTPAPAPTKAP